MHKIGSTTQGTPDGDRRSWLKLSDSGNLGSAGRNLLDPKPLNKKKQSLGAAKQDSLQNLLADMNDNFRGLDTESRAGDKSELSSLYQMP